jgi:hypothetical protein
MDIAIHNQEELVFRIHTNPYPRGGQNDEQRNDAYAQSVVPEIEKIFKGVKDVNLNILCTDSAPIIVFSGDLGKAMQCLQEAGEFRDHHAAALCQQLQVAAQKNRIPVGFAGAVKNFMAAAKKVQAMDWQAGLTL